MNAIETIRPLVDGSGLLTAIDVYSDRELADQRVGIRLTFAENVLFVYPDGTDDSICVSSTFPALLSDSSIHREHAPSAWASAIGHPILWAWTMTNTQGRVDGIQIEFGTVETPSIALQMLVRASTVIVRVLLVTSR